MGDERIGTAVRAVPDHGPGPRQAAAPEVTATAARSPILLELVWLVFLVWIYDWLQDLAPLRRAQAFDHARNVLAFEARYGINVERTLDHWLAHERILAFLASNFYSNAIFAVTFAFAAYLWWWRPDLYRPLRNDLVLANLIGFAVFWAYPVAPPRMLPGFIDVVVKAGGLGAWHDTLIKHADQFAAMPSMHLGYAVWCSLVAWRIARHRTSRRVALAFGIGYPVLTAFVVLGTGNHYVLDVLAGTATVVVSVLVLEVLPGFLRRRWADDGGGPATHIRDLDTEPVAAPPGL